MVHRRLRGSVPPLRVPLEGTHNLPALATSFIGRRQEIAAVRGLLAESRMVTLTGAAGCGKTRLALAVAEEVIPEWPDGIWLVELARVGDGEALPHVVANALRLTENASNRTVENLSDQLRTRRMLLILDNCEHLIAECARLASSLLRTCPELRILATSREILYIGGESAWKVPSLSIPDTALPASAREIKRFESVRLFAERASAARPSFRIDARNARHVARICRQLDGIPLAIELAAARIADLTARELAERIHDRFRLLVGDADGCLPRHRTLRAAIDWSYALLTGAERSLLQRLSVFAGGCTLGLVESVCVDADAANVQDSHLSLQGAGAPSPDLLDTITSLVDKSLVVAEENSGETRYRMLEMIRQYGAERLRESGDEARIRRLHVQALAEMAEEAEPALVGAGQRQWIERLSSEHDNVRTAFEWLRRDQMEDHPALRLVAGLWRFWLLRGSLHEGRRWAEESLLDRVSLSSAPRELLARALNGAGSLAWRQGDAARARVYYEESLAIRREIGDRQGIAGSLNNLGLVARKQNDLEGARKFFEESLAIYRERDHEWGSATSLSNLASVAVDQGDHDSADRFNEEALALWDRVGDQCNLATCYNGRGNIAWLRGNNSEALSAYCVALRLLHTNGITGVIESLTSAAHAISALGDSAKATILIAAARVARERLGIPGNDGDRARDMSLLTDVRAKLGVRRFRTALMAGERAGLNEAITLALGFQSAYSPTS